MRSSPSWLAAVSASSSSSSASPTCRRRSGCGRSGSPSRRPGRQHLPAGHGSPGSRSTGRSRRRASPGARPAQAGRPPRACGLRAVEAVRVRVDLERAVEAVVLADCAEVERVRIDLGRVVDTSFVTVARNTPSCSCRNSLGIACLPLKSVPVSTIAQSSRSAITVPSFWSSLVTTCWPSIPEPPRLLSHPRVPIRGIRYARRSLNPLLPLIAG